jgi:glutathione peroxidase
MLLITTTRFHAPPPARVAPAGRRIASRWAVAVLLSISFSLALRVEASECPDILRYQFPSLQSGETRDLCQYQGKVVLVVNTASYCAYTDQYGGLETLYRELQSQGLMILGFPSNDFGGQEPGNSKEISNFCRLTYGVEFPMFGKAQVVGAGRNGLFAELQRRTGEEPRWNFHKYLIDRSGSQVLSFGSAVAPEDERFRDAVRALLNTGVSGGRGD